MSGRPLVLTALMEFNVEDLLAIVPTFSCRLSGVGENRKVVRDALTKDAGT